MFGVEHELLSVGLGKRHGGRQWGKLRPVFSSWAKTEWATAVNAPLQSRWIPMSNSCKRTHRKEAGDKPTGLMFFGYYDAKCSIAEIEVGVDSFDSSDWMFPHSNCKLLQFLPLMVKTTSVQHQKECMHLVPKPMWHTTAWHSAFMAFASSDETTHWDSVTCHLSFFCRRWSGVIRFRGFASQAGWNFISICSCVLCFVCSLLLFLFGDITCTKQARHLLGFPCLFMWISHLFQNQWHSDTIHESILLCRDQGRSAVTSMQGSSVESLRCQQPVSMWRSRQDFACCLSSSPMHMQMMVIAFMYPPQLCFEEMKAANSGPLVTGTTPSRIWFEWQAPSATSAGTDM